MRIALITGGTRGIGKGIALTLAASGEYGGFILTYNTNYEAAQEIKTQILADYTCIQKIELIGGDLTQEETRDQIFNTLDTEFLNNENENDNENNNELTLLVHNAGQYVGVTSGNALDMKQPEQPKCFGDGSLINKETGKVDVTYMQYYQKLYSEAWVDLCERCLHRMKQSYEKNPTSYYGSIVGISSPGCNSQYKMTPGYDMPGSGKSVMEFTIRPYAAIAAKYNINCNIVIPGFTKSGAWETIAKQRNVNVDELLQQLVTKVPIQRYLQPTDIGDVVAFIAGPGGGRFMTGLNLRVDGGLHLGTTWEK